MENSKFSYRYNKYLDYCLIYDKENIESEPDYLYNFDFSNKKKLQKVFMIGYGIYIFSNFK